MKPAMLLFGTALLAFAGSSRTSFAAPSCGADLRMMRTELDNAPSGQARDQAMTLYSSAMQARSRGQTGLCMSDLNDASNDLAATTFGPPDTDNGGDSGFWGSRPHHDRDHGHDHDGGHGHGRLVALKG
jgi:hypothetical protein